MKVVLIRHGITPGNEKKVYSGKTDEHLSPAGRRMLEEYRDAGKYPAVGLIYTSTLSRTCETCEIIYPGRPYTRIHDLRETDFGDFEGQSYEELESDPRYMEWMASGGYLPFPNGEGIREMQARCCRAFAEVMNSCETGMLTDQASVSDVRLCENSKINAEKNKNPDAGSDVEIENHTERTVAFVVHGGTIMALLSALSDEGKEYFDYYTRNGEGYTADYRDGRLTNCKAL